MGLVIISALAVITVAAVYVAFKSGRKLQRPPKITGSAGIPNCLGSWGSVFGITSLFLHFA